MLIVDVSSPKAKTVQCTMSKNSKAIKNAPKVVNNDKMSRHDVTINHDCLQ